MKARITQFLALGATIAAWIVGVGGCTTAELEPKAPLPAAPPPYVQVPHPAGYDMGDLRAIFTTKEAPPADVLADCDGDFRKLKTLTQAKEEIVQGARELVRQDPVKLHWCFYSKILKLEDDLKSQDFLEERQKSVLEAYAFLTPIGRAFIQEYRDSRYMRWAIKHYSGISAWVFYRKVELTPQATSELVEASNPYGLLREPANVLPVLEKYNLAKPSVPAEPPVVGGVPPTAPGAADSGAVGGPAAAAGAAQEPASAQAVAPASDVPAADSSALMAQPTPVAPPAQVTPAREPATR